MTLNRPRSKLQSFHIKYLECRKRYDIGQNGGHIGNHQWASNWHHDHQPWMILNCTSSISSKLHSNISQMMTYTDSIGQTPSSFERFLFCYIFSAPHDDTNMPGCLVRTPETRHSVNVKNRASKFVPQLISSICVHILQCYIRPMSRSLLLFRPVAKRSWEFWRSIPKIHTWNLLFRALPFMMLVFWLSYASKCT